MRRIANCLVILVASCALAPKITRLNMTTWSIAALDPDSGDVGVAVASCVPDAHVDAVAALVPGVGVAVTQAVWILDNRNRVYEALRAGLSAEEVIERVADADIDANLARRQYGAVTLSDGEIRIAGFTGQGADAWSGIRFDLDMAVSVQGNTLVGEAVVADALAAFLANAADGKNTLADRLLRGLEAGSAAGGDVRCNQDGISSTAATAAILLARGGDPPYAAQTIRMTDQGTAAAPWLSISEAGPAEGPNPILEVRRRYEEWRQAIPEGD